MIEPILANTRDHMKKALDITVADLGSLRSGRANSALVENIVISAYGGTQKLKVMEMATITTMDAKTIVVAPYDPSTLMELEKGIQEGNTGLNPVIDKDILRITIQPLSEERRQEYIKLARAKLESGRVMIRQIRQDAMKGVKKLSDEKEVSEDQWHYGEKKIQELTDEFIAEIDALGQRKEQELLTV